MTDLAAWLLEQIEADEAAARAAIGDAVFQHQTGRWSFEKVRDEFGDVPIVFAVADGGGKTQVANLEAAWEREERGAHIARNDPARTLARCKAYRTIIAEHRIRADVLAEDYCDTCADASGLDEIGLVSWPCPTLRALASEWAGAEGWQEGWAL
jgi:hypothetical protein